MENYEAVQTLIYSLSGGMLSGIVWGLFRNFWKV